MPSGNSTTAMSCRHVTVLRRCRWTDPDSARPVSGSVHRDALERGHGTRSPASSRPASTAGRDAAGTPLARNTRPYTSRGRGRGRGLPPVPALPARSRARRRAGSTRPSSCAARCARIADGALDGATEDDARAAARRERAPPAPPVRRARRRDAGRGRAQPRAPTSPGACSTTPTCRSRDVGYAAGLQQRAPDQPRR